MPLFAALPPTDLPTHAYIPPTAVHGTAPLSLDLALSVTRTHTVRSGDTVYDIAARYGVSAQAIVRANSLSDGGRWILPGDILRIPGAVAVPAPGQSSASDRANSSTQSASPSTGGTVTVRAGDTLTHIAARHSTTVAKLVSTNNISNSRLIYPGQILTLPGSGSSSSSSTSSSSSSSSGAVTVRAGDTLYGIAAQHGTTVDALARANSLDDTRLIYPGQRLSLPGSSTPSSSSSSGSSSSSSSSPSRSGIPSSLSRPYDEHTIGNLLTDEEVQSTFLHYQYSSATARAAAANRIYLSNAQVPSQDELKAMIIDTSNRHGVDPKLMVALSFQESGWNQRAVSPANAIGAMQVIPTSGQWASSLIGRELNLLDPQDNVTAGVVVMRALMRSADSTDAAIGGYYQGLGSVRQYGLFSDTRQYVTNIKHLMRTQ
ncbi:lytic transglycosylase domain-containing protein [Ornithinimicrobium pratense]|uniref:LysM peptidoglycan-binding domain-containing protein n=1 Tax=Ornithinimicrobium pratense TaxID=2593973 RepID=A0A5J6V3G7_9MICO|nr:lytic transglycosylase domain-containing protein [Ornithinimicrobium pratense]QFG68255.1 LysM peptidoglycan-binding domain-containing protein [Ornithinimicrobium pratense]